jgi:hypothetical protein
MARLWIILRTSIGSAQVRALQLHRHLKPWRALMIASGSVIPRQDIDAARESQMTALANINP